jgi:hypothetical protein
MIVEMNQKRGTVARFPAPALGEQPHPATAL